MAKIQTTHGDILKADVEALVNTVNCVGIMGRGVALQFKKAYPENFKAYADACERGKVQPGKMFVYDLGTLTNPRYIINFPTKKHWKGKSQLAFIDAGLKALVREIQERGIKSIALPPLGCGLGGLKWKDVYPRIEKALQNIPELRTLVFQPQEAPAPEAMVKAAKAPKMTPGRAALLGLMDRYLAGLMDPFVSLLEIHKLMYFLQESGQSLRLQFEKAPYGPYARNLRHVLIEIEGHLITGYGDGDDKPERLIEAKPEAIRDANEFLMEHSDTCDRFARVIDLIQGFETPYGMELLATVHWVAKNEDAKELESAVKQVHAWSDRKKQWDRQQISVAWEALKSKGWLSN